VSSGFDFTFDVTKPTMISVNDTDPHTWENPEKTYHTTSLYATWLGEDEISDVEYYRVSIHEQEGSSCTGQLIMNWTDVFSDEERFNDFIDDEELLNDHKYCFIVFIR